MLTLLDQAFHIVIQIVDLEQPEEEKSKDLEEMKIRQG